MEWTRLNVFQSLARQWDTLHPYNAAQAMRLAGRADLSLITSAFRSTLSELGLGPVSVRGSSFRWASLNGTMPDDGYVKLLPAGASLESHMTCELSKPFDGQSPIPFRAFVIDDGDSHCLGVVYHHWIADSFSIRLLMREWFLRMHEPSAAQRKPLDIATRGYWQSFGPWQADWSMLGALLEVGRWGARFRRTRRLDPEGFIDFRTHFTMHSTPDGLIGAVSSTARRRGATVNDVFLAAMAEVCHRFVPVRGTTRRRDLALGTIVDLRSRVPGPINRDFGLFLGFMSVFCSPEDLDDFDELLRRIHHENLMQKSAAAAEASMMRMLAGLVIGQSVSSRRLREFYRKRVALAGGISNVNLNGDWPARYYPGPMMEYVRVSPCGPMMPVVFTPTTLGDRLNFGLTCRGSVIPANCAGKMAEMFVSRLQKFAGF